MKFSLLNEVGDMNIIGDVHGNYDALVRLAKIMPDEEFIGVGDLIDRGTRSREVINFFINNGRCVLGNHEHMMLDLYNAKKVYNETIWFLVNGGKNTLLSYADNDDAKKAIVELFEDANEKLMFRFTIDKETLDQLDKHYRKETRKIMKSLVDSRHIEWLESLPLYIDEDGLIITHAPIKDGDVHVASNLKTTKLANNILWNVFRPNKRIDGKFQIHGHIIYDETIFYGDEEGVYGVGIDTRHHLCGMNWPKKEVYSVEF